MIKKYGRFRITSMGKMQVGLTSFGQFRFTILNLR